MQRKHCSISTVHEYCNITVAPDPDHSSRIQQLKYTKCHTRTFHLYQSWLTTLENIIEFILQNTLYYVSFIPFLANYDKNHIQVLHSRL